MRFVINKQGLLAGVTIAAMMGLPLAAQAMADPLIEGARQCTQHFPVEEKRNTIPTHLLAAISSTESGRWHNGLGLALPWPWTINVEGKGYYFDSKAEAVAQTAALLKAGRRSIDVGCMQVNLKHHPDAFASVDEAFEPAKNIAYGAKFLRNNYNQTGDWVKATAAYHSQTSSHGQRYLGQIERSWNRIVSKVQQARVVQGIPVEPVQTPKFTSPSMVEVNKTPQTQSKPQVIKVSANGKSTVQSVDKSAPIKLARTSNIVKVTEQPAPQQATLLVPVKQQPAAAKPEITLANAGDAAMQDNVLVRGSSGTIRKVRIDSTGATSDNETGSKTNFVFAN